MSRRTDAQVEEVEPVDWPLIAVKFGDHNYENSYSYAAAIAAKSGSSIRFFRILSEQLLIGAACVRVKKIPLLKFGVAYISGGPLVHECQSVSFNMERMKTVLAALDTRIVKQDRNVLFVRLAVTPPSQVNDLVEFLELRGFKDTNLVRRYETILVDLSVSEAELRSKLHQKWRNHLNRSIRSDIKVEAGNSPSFRERFLVIYEEMKKRKGFDSNIDPNFFFKLDQADTGTVIFLALKEGKDVGGHVISLLGTTAVYLFGATNEVGLTNYAGYLLHWTAMHYARERGFRCYDLGGIDRVANPGGYQFKSQAGGEIVMAAGPFQAHPAGWIYGLLNQIMARRKRS